MRIPALAAALLLATACAKTLKVETNPSAGKVDVDIQAPNTPETYSATLTSVGTSGIAGTASGSTAGDSTMVTVNVSGASPNSTLPWHIHEGKCGDASPPIVGDASAYPPISIGAGGTGSATAHVKAGLNEAKNYIVNVHASPTNLGTIVACGDFND